MSKVKENIEQLKRKDKISSAATATATSSPNYNYDVNTTLEDLYGIDEQNSVSSTKAKTELRKTLRELKEKDLLILKLREACHDLTLKYADAENTIDQLRFRSLLHGGNGARTTGRHSKNINNGGQMTKSRSALCLAGISSNNNNNVVPQIEKVESKPETREQATLTSPIPELLKTNLDEGDDEYNNSNLSSFDVLDESCSNWIEKIQNWKTADSLFNTSADADSGFRGSEINIVPGYGSNSKTTDITVSALLNHISTTSAGGVAAGSNLQLQHPLLRSHLNLSIPTAPTTTTNSSSGGCSRKDMMKYLAHRNHHQHQNQINLIPNIHNNDESELYSHELVMAVANTNKTVSVATKGTNTEEPKELELNGIPSSRNLSDTTVVHNHQNCRRQRHDKEVFEACRNIEETARQLSSVSLKSRSRELITNVHNEGSTSVSSGINNQYYENYGRFKSQSYNDLHLVHAATNTTTNPESHEETNKFNNYKRYNKRYSMSNVGGIGAPSSRYYNASTTYFKSLDPLLDDATKLAKRVQLKSARLTRTLQQTINEGKRK